MTNKPRMPKYHQSAKTITSYQSHANGPEKSRTSRQTAGGQPEESPAKGGAHMPNSTKASQNRIINLKNTQAGAGGQESRNDGVEGGGAGVHKSYNGGMPRQGAGLQPTGFKGGMMPMINSGKGLLNEQQHPGDQPGAHAQAHPKSSGFRSNRNSHYDPQSLNLQQNCEGNQKWQSNINTQRSGGGHLSRKNGINSSHDQPQYPAGGVLANHSYQRNQQNVLSAGNNKPPYGSINYNNPGDSSFFGDSSPTAGAQP